MPVWGAGSPDNRCSKAQMLSPYPLEIFQCSCLMSLPEASGSCARGSGHLVQGSLVRKQVLYYNNYQWCQVDQPGRSQGIGMDRLPSAAMKPASATAAAHHAEAADALSLASPASASFTLLTGSLHMSVHKSRSFTASLQMCELGMECRRFSPLQTVPHPAVACPASPQ